MSYENRARDLTDEELLKELMRETTCGIDSGAFRRQIAFKAQVRIVEKLNLVEKLLRSLGAVACLLLFVGCSTTGAETESRPFYYFHTNYPEHMDNDAGCHGCRSRYSDDYAEDGRSSSGFSERERGHRLRKLYGKMR